MVCHLHSSLSLWTVEVTSSSRLQLTKWAEKRKEKKRNKEIVHCQRKILRMETLNANQPGIYETILTKGTRKYAHYNKSFSLWTRYKWKTIVSSEFWKGMARLINLRSYSMKTGKPIWLGRVSYRFVLYIVLQAYQMHNQSLKSIVHQVLQLFDAYSVSAGLNVNSILSLFQSTKGTKTPKNCRLLHLH